MKKLFYSLSLVALILSACQEKSSVIQVDVPSRPAGQEDMLGFAAPAIDTVRVGFVGIGSRGSGAVYSFTFLENVKIVALCDMQQEQIDKCQGYLEEKGLPKAVEYTGSLESYKQLCERDDIDLVYIATDWIHHAPVAQYAMEHGKHAVIEVPAATTMEEIWSLINTSEKTRKHCMMLENCCYDFFEMATLNMAQQGLFGDIVHVEGAYLHCLNGIWDSYWNQWRLDFNSKFKGDIYPTHGLGPLCQILNIHRGDSMETLVAMSSDPVNGPVEYKKLYGKECEDFQNGDHTMTMIRTAKGKTIQIQHDVLNPRPYSRMFQIVGTNGYASKYPVEGISFDPERMPEDFLSCKYYESSFLEDAVRDSLLEAYSPRIVKEIGEFAKKVGGHGGMDFIMMYRLIYCLHNGLPLDMDVYDLAEWCCLGPLGAISIENNSAPVQVPDFTRGGQDKIKGFSYAFAD